jgi:hypothetical protein
MKCKICGLEKESTEFEVVSYEDGVLKDAKCKTCYARMNKGRVGGVRVA